MASLSFTPRCEAEKCHKNMGGEQVASVGKAGPPKFPIPTSSHIIFISVVRLRVDGVERVEVWIASTSSSQRVKFKERNGKRSRTHRTFSSGRWDRDEKIEKSEGVWL